MWPEPRPSSRGDLQCRPAPVQRSGAERDRPEGRLRARSATAAHGAFGPAPTRGAACCAAGGGGGVCARGRFLPRTGVGAARVLGASGFSQALRGEPGLGASSAGQDRERVREGRGLLAGLLGGLSSTSSSEEPLRRRCRGLEDVGALGGGGGDDAGACGRRLVCTGPERLGPSVVGDPALWPPSLTGVLRGILLSPAGTNLHWSRAHWPRRKSRQGSVLLAFLMAPSV